MFTNLLMLSTLLAVSLAWNIPLPGGGKVSYKDGLLRIRTEKVDAPPFPQVDSTPSAKTLSSIEVRDTKTKKGFGAYCTVSLPEGTFLGFYEGCILESVEDCENGGDYLLSLDGGTTFMDGYERAQDRTSFSPAHLNHADKRTAQCNCVRLLENKQVAFFTARQVEAGEELCFDYGANYWRNRERAKILEETPDSL